MQIYRLTVGPDGRVTVPNTRPGQTVTVQVEPVPVHAEPEADSEPLTLATAKTPEERAEVIAEMKAIAQELRGLLKDDLPISTDELYGEDGLPA